MPKGKARKPSKKRERISATVASIRPAQVARKSNRVCGDCTACCSAMAVHAIDKPAFTTCSRLNDARSDSPSSPGCTDYPNRPQACRDFRCAWLNDFPMTGTNERPDRLGLILIPTVDPQVIQVREVWPDASTETRAQNFITELRRAGIRIELVSREEQRTLQPLTIFGRPATMIRSLGPVRAAR